MDEVRPPRTTWGIFEQGHELRDALWVRIDGSYEDFYSSIVIDLTGRDVFWVNAADWKLVN